VASARPIVNPPAFTPLPYSLWDVAEHLPAPAHWQAGVTWIDRCPAGDSTYDECVIVTGSDGGAVPEPPAKTDNVLQEFRGATPFTVFAEFDCSPVGLGDEAAINALATEALARTEDSQTELSFWTGAAGGQTVVFPHLAADTEVVDEHGIVLQPVATIAASGSDIVTLDPAVAFGQLGHQLDQCYGGLGTFYIPRFALPTFIALRVLEDRNGTLYTPSGHKVVVSGMFPGTSPAGDDPPEGQAWIYATGPVFGYRGEVFATRRNESFDRAENTVQMIAERTYVFGFPCCLLAALMDLGVPTV
jgi:hypothetical protein